MFFRHVLFYLLLAVVLFAQPVIKHAEPPFWWTGMVNNDVQILFHGENISEYEPALDYPGVTITDILTTSGKNYLFVTIQITDEAKPGDVKFIFSGNDNSFDFNFPLKERENIEKPGKITSADVVYLITPDRFVNGDESNDSVSGYKDTTDRNIPNARHGGDIAGIISKLDYIKDLGFSAIWPMPLTENNQDWNSYHGYSITDFYNIDKRFGSNELYIDLVNKSHEKGIKVIQDMVFNQIGDHHYWYKDPPAEDWFHVWPEYTRSNFNSSVIPDPNASEYDYKKMVQGWFDRMMPDLNQDNRILARYLIQNSIWWVEYAGIDGIRVDTYQYNYKDFLNEWLTAMYAEYPDLFIVGEVWYSDPAVISYWKEGVDYPDGFKSKLKSITDFPFEYSIEEVFSGNKPVTLLYDVIARDFLYEDPATNLVFADNHDVTRLYTRTGEDLNRFKQALAVTLTTRGIPQVYYGTEILMTGERHEILRADFPGGWKGDKRDAFTESGRTDKENEAYNFIKTLLNYRKNSEALTKGRLVHFQPYKKMYVFFRIAENGNTVMTVINTNDKPVKLDYPRHTEILGEFTSGTDIISGKKIEDFNNFEVAPDAAMVVELTR